MPFTPRRRQKWTIYSMQRACSVNLMKKTALSRYNVLSLSTSPNPCLSAVYVWTMCLWIQSPALIPVDIHFAVNAFADTLSHASKSIDFLYNVPPVLRTRGRERSKLAVRVASRSQLAHPSRDLTSEVSQSLALELGLTNEQFTTWTEMEMVAFSILLHCRMYVRLVHPLTSCTKLPIFRTGANGQCS